MSKYRFYNISLLPQNVQQEEVGVKGYKSFFEIYKALVDEARQNKSFAPLAFPLRNEMFFAFFNITIEEKYAYGTMVKYDQPESIVDLFSGESLATIQRGGSAHRYIFDFLFNFENHIFAINNKDGRLPSPSPFLKSFELFFNDIANNNFPNHVLEIGQITSSQAVEDAYNAAEKFKRGEVTVTFSNSTLFEEQIIKEVEAELKEKSIEKTTIIESSSPKGLMTDLSKYFKALLGIA